VHGELLGDGELHSTFPACGTRTKPSQRYLKLVARAPLPVSVLASTHKGFTLREDADLYANGGLQVYNDTATYSSCMHGALRCVGAMHYLIKSHLVPTRAQRAAVKPTTLSCLKGIGLIPCAVAQDVASPLFRSCWQVFRRV
jgi:hypothetical protein